ncbi:hypothetical protein LTS10_005550 [Elasticomyces elasticus]|nr:hypothetical protein LTS10_005550 [Elasticomyces elasticus]
MTDIIDLDERPDNHNNSVSRRRVAPPTAGQTSYLSKNNDTKVKFAAIAPPGSKHAAALRDLCMDVQDGPKPSTKMITGRPESSRQALGATYADSENRVMVRKKGQPQRVIDEAPSSPGPWYRRETAREVAYHSKSARGEMFVSAPKGSEEAAFYDDLAENASAVGCLS